MEIKRAKWRAWRALYTIRNMNVMNVKPWEYLGAYYLDESVKKNKWKVVQTLQEVEKESHTTIIF